MESVCEEESLVRESIAGLHTVAPGSIGDKMGFRLLSYDGEKQEWTFSCVTEEWMRNAAGTLHGGMCAAVLDQAMGYIAWCVKPGPGYAPTVQMQLAYHRPLIPGQNVRIKVRLVAVTKSLIHLASEAYSDGGSGKLCLSATGIYFYKPAPEEKKS